MIKSKNKSSFKKLNKKLKISKKILSIHLNDQPIYLQSSIKFYPHQKYFTLNCLSNYLMSHISTKVFVSSDPTRTLPSTYDISSTPPLPSTLPIPSPSLFQDCPLSP